MKRSALKLDPLSSVIMKRSALKVYQNCLIMAKRLDLILTIQKIQSTPTIELSESSTKLVATKIQRIETAIDLSVWLNWVYLSYLADYMVLLE